jgi:hypothetical protein
MLTVRTLVDPVHTFMQLMPSMRQDFHIQESDVFLNTSINEYENETFKIPSHSQNF